MWSRRTFPQERRSLTPDYSNTSRIRECYFRSPQVLDTPVAEPSQDKLNCRNRNEQFPNLFIVLGFDDIPIGGNPWEYDCAIFVS